MIARENKFRRFKAFIPDGMDLEKTLMHLTFKILDSQIVYETAEECLEREDIDGEQVVIQLSIERYKNHGKK